MQFNKRYQIKLNISPDNKAFYRIVSSNHPATAATAGTWTHVGQVVSRIREEQKE
jgi:hypothetical protein